MARKVFFSFHYKPDSHRVSQVRNIGVIEGNQGVKDNEWEIVTKGGDAAIKKWIAEQMQGRSCTMVLVGSNTAGRKWIKHEIKKTWDDNKGLVGIYINGLKDLNGYESSKGQNPFDDISCDGEKLSSIVNCYDPRGSNSKERYNWIKENIEDIVEEAIKIRESN